MHKKINKHVFSHHQGKCLLYFIWVFKYVYMQIPLWLLYEIKNTSLKFKVFKFCIKYFSLFQSTEIPTIIINNISEAYKIFYFILLKENSATKTKVKNKFPFQILSSKSQSWISFTIPNFNSFKKNVQLIDDSDSVGSFKTQKVLTSK